MRLGSWPRVKRDRTIRQKDARLSSVPSGQSAVQSEEVGPGLGFTGHSNPWGALPFSFYGGGLALGPARMASGRAGCGQQAGPPQSAASFLANVRINATAGT